MDDEDELKTWLQVYAISGTIKVLPQEIAWQLMSDGFIAYEHPSGDLHITDKGFNLIKGE